MTPEPFYHNICGYSWWLSDTAQGHLPARIFDKLDGGTLSATKGFQYYKTLGEAMEDYVNAKRLASTRY